MIDSTNYKQIDSEFMFFKQNSIKESYILNLSSVREFSCYTQTLQSSKNNLLGLKLCRCLCEASVVYVHQRPKLIKSDRYKRTSKFITKHISRGIPLYKQLRPQSVQIAFLLFSSAVVLIFCEYNELFLTSQGGKSRKQYLCLEIFSSPFVAL